MVVKCPIHWFMVFTVCDVLTYPQRVPGEGLLLSHPRLRVELTWEPQHPVWYQYLAVLSPCSEEMSFREHATQNVRFKRDGCRKQWKTQWEISLDFLDLSYLSYLLKRWEHLLLFFFFTPFPPDPYLVTLSAALSPTMNLALLCCSCKPIEQCTMETGNDFLGFLLVLGLLCQVAQRQRIPSDPSL